MQAAPVSTSLPRAVSSILQWSTHFGVSDTGTSELFRIVHKSFAIAGGSDDSITSIPTSLDKAIAMVNTMKQPKVSELLVCPDCLSVYGDWHEMQVSHCIHVAAPFHTQCSWRGTCGVALYRSGAVHRPILVYPYISIVESLKAFLARPGFSDACRLITSESSHYLRK